MTDGWNPWKVTAIGMALVVATAVTTGLVVASRVAPEHDRTPDPSAATTPAPPPPPPAVSRPAAHRPAAPHRVARAESTVPTRVAIEECNRYAASQAAPENKTLEVVKDAAVGAALGAAVGAAGGAVAKGGSGAGKGAAIGGIVGAGGGTLYGLNENHKRDERYREAYAQCMSSRGFARAS